MTVQDDERERELVRLFNLDWNPAHQRAGIDAVLTLDHAGSVRRIEVEVKSTTGDTVSTARDVGMEHIAKWRNKLFVIGFYTKEARRPELLRCLCLTPADMAPWIDALEAKIGVDFRIADIVGRKMQIADLHVLCGAKDAYTLDDAKNILRQQWSLAEYQQGADLRVDGQPCFSPGAMLRVLGLRAAYIARRGATLNNPHITKAHLAAFLGTDREVTGNWAACIRDIAAAWLGKSSG